MGFWLHMNIWIISRDLVLWQEDMGCRCMQQQEPLKPLRTRRLWERSTRNYFMKLFRQEDFVIGDLTITPIHISHDAADPVAYRIKKENRTFAVVTDLGNYDDEIVQQLQGLDTLLLEANHDIHMLETGVYPYPLKRRIMGNRGHLSNERSGQLLCELLHDKFGTVVLGHLSKENNYEELAYEAVRLEVTMGDNPYKADDFPMYVAKRNAVSPVIRAE